MEKRLLDWIQEWCGYMGKSKKESLEIENSFLIYIHYINPKSESKLLKIIETHSDPMEIIGNMMCIQQYKKHKL